MKKCPTYCPLKTRSIQTSSLAVQLGCPPESRWSSVQLSYLPQMFHQVQCLLSHPHFQPKRLTEASYQCSVVQLQYFGPTCVHIKDSTEEESQIQMSNRVLQPRSPQSGSAVQLTIPLQCLNMDMCNCHCPAPGHFMLVFSPSHLDVLLKCLLMRLSMKQPEETSH